jgi:hypothetical protein
MKTLTLTVDPDSAPIGAICRIYHRDDNTYLGETTSDGSGILVFSVDDAILGEVQLETMVDGIDGVVWPTVTKLVIE